jgi:hypothetical protein
MLGILYEKNSVEVLVDPATELGIMDLVIVEKCSIWVELTGETVKNCHIYS